MFRSRQRKSGATRQVSAVSFRPAAGSCVYPHGQRRLAGLGEMAIHAHIVRSDRERVIVRAVHRAVGLHMTGHALIGQVKRAGNRELGGIRQPRVRTRIESGRAVRQFADGTEQEIVLQRMVRCAGRVRPGRPAVVVALGAQIDVGVRVVLVCEHVRGREGKIVGREDGIAKLRRIAVGLMRIVANDTGDSDVQVIREREEILTVDQGQSGRAGMATAATVDVIRG